jgi:hypothetical protein
MSKKADKKKNAKNVPPKHGVCKLTGATGQFMDSHLIPAALTRLSRTGEPYVEAGIDRGMKRRFNSWYDGQLVVREGEDILAAIDVKGIDALRRHKLVWSGWPGGQDLLAEFRLHGGQGPGARVIEVPEAADLQLFFVRLLWRAAATKRHEFSDVSLPVAVVEDLRQRVLKQQAGAYADYPVQLFQLADRGIEHNRTPKLEVRDLGPAGVLQAVRFYFDGLTAHVYVPQGAAVDPELLKTCLGTLPDGRVIIFGHRFANSRAASDIEVMVRTVAKQPRYPGPAARFSGRRARR